MNRYLKYFFFPIFIVIIACIGIIILKNTLYVNNFDSFVGDFGLIDLVGYAFYLFLFFTFYVCYDDFKGKEEKKDYFVFLFFAVSAVLREAGIQHWITSKDTTAFKIKFFTNPNNPFGEKLFAGLCLFLIVSYFFYAMIFFLIPAFKGFFKGKAGSCTIITLLSLGAICKIADRLPANLRHYGIAYSDVFAQYCELVEESFEMLLPVLAAIAFWQYHFQKKTGEILFFKNAEHR